MIKFGASGNSENYFNSGYVGSEYSHKWTKELNLDCFEYSFGRGVNIGEETARRIGENFKGENIELSVHAPYFINFASVEEEKVNNSYGYVLSSLKVAKIMGANRVVFHPATQGKLTREEACSLTKDRLKILAEKIIENGYQDMKVCIETMGKLAQIGTLEEVCDFCSIASFYYPCVDFGHINSREQGSLQEEKDYTLRFNYIKEKLGEEKLNNTHIHFSKIMYSKKGEVKHLTFLDDVYGPDYVPFIKSVKSLNITPYIICESAGTQDVDAKKMKDLYYSL